jgi:hypothetical protein
MLIVKNAKSVTVGGKRCLSVCQTRDAIMQHYHVVRGMSLSESSRHADATMIQLDTLRVGQSISSELIEKFCVHLKARGCAS